MVGILASKSRRAERSEEPVKSHVLITRYDAGRVQRGEMLKVEDVVEMLALPLLGVIPESESVLQASNVGAPVVLDEESKAGQAYRDAVARYLGEQLEYRYVAAEKGGFAGFGPLGFFTRLWRRSA
jgi:septum site-determining protein MinD